MEDGGLTQHQRSLLSSLLRGSVLSVLIAVLLFACLAFMFRDEEIKRFDLSNDRRIVISAESAFHYEPPGYIYYEISERGEIRVPRRRCLGVGPERIPVGTYDLVATRDGNLVAVRLNRNVIVMHDFATNQTWPGKYSIVDWQHFVRGKEFLARFASDGHQLQCAEIERYLPDRLPSPDGSMFVTHVWGEEPKGKRSRLQVRLVGKSGKELQLIATKDTLSLEDQLSLNKWRAGWLDADTFAVWAEAFGTRVWRFYEDGSYSEVHPVADDVSRRVRNLPEPPWWIMHSR